MPATLRNLTERVLTVMCRELRGGAFKMRREMYSEFLKPVAAEQPHSVHFLQRILVQLQT